MATVCCNMQWCVIVLRDITEVHNYIPTLILLKCIDLLVARYKRPWKICGLQFKTCKNARNQSVHVCSEIALVLLCMVIVLGSIIALQFHDITFSHTSNQRETLLYINNVYCIDCGIY